MKLTAKQLRQIIRQETSRLTEIFTPVGSIGFAPLPRRPRTDYHDLCLETDVDECGTVAAPAVQAQVDVMGDAPAIAVDPAQAVVEQIVESGVNIADVVHKLVIHLNSRG